MAPETLKAMDALFAEVLASEETATPPAPNTSPRNELLATELAKAAFGGNINQVHFAHHPF